MNTFNTFGANYTLGFALRALFARSRKENEEKLTRILAKRYHSKAILTYKCREAIVLALQNSKLAPGSFVAICRFSCREVIDAIATANLRPAFIDLEKNTLHFSEATLRKALAQNPKIRAVLVQNTLGYPADGENIARTCRENKLVLIEDLAHCFGAVYANGKEAGTLGDFVALSFSQNKILDATAGGALIVRKVNPVPMPKQPPHLRRQAADRIYPLCAYLIAHSYPLYLLFQKVIAIAKPITNPGVSVHKLPIWYCLLILERLAESKSQLSHRRKIAGIYARMLPKKILSATLTNQINPSAHFRFPIFVAQKELLIAYLAKHAMYIDDPWYIVPNSITLPTGQNITVKKAQEISQHINTWLKINRF